MLLRTVGWLLMVLSGFMAIPMLATFVYKDSSSKPFLLSMFITLVCASDL